jgi:hypothetical protein
MGQRLNIEIIKNGETIANCYYHWSAYTTSALSTAIMVISNYEELLKQNLPDEVLAVKMFENCYSYLPLLNNEATYAGLSEESYKYMTEKYPGYEFKQVIDRNAGIIGVTDEDIEETRKYEEGTLYIYLDNKTIDNSGLLWEQEIEEYEDEYEETVNADRLKVLPCDNLSTIPFDKAEKILSDLFNNKSSIYISNDKKSVIMFIE